MTAKEFTATREALGETKTSLARRLGVSFRAVHYWETGERRISPPIERLLKTLRPRKS